MDCTAIEMEDTFKSLRLERCDEDKIAYAILRLRQTKNCSNFLIMSFSNGRTHDLRIPDSFKKQRVFRSKHGMTILLTKVKFMD